MKKSGKDKYKNAKFDEEEERFVVLSE